MRPGLAAVCSSLRLDRRVHPSAPASPPRPRSFHSQQEGQGLRPFFRGVGPRALSNGLNSAIFFCFFEAIRQVREHADVHSVQLRSREGCVGPDNRLQCASIAQCRLPALLPDWPLPPNCPLPALRC